MDVKNDDGLRVILGIDGDSLSQCFSIVFFFFFLVWIPFIPILTGMDPPKHSIFFFKCPTI